MISIALVHEKKAFLPEAGAYTRFFAAWGIDCVVVHPRDLQGLERDVEWYFMGRDLSPTLPGVCRIHEYASASVPPFRRWKDLAKVHLMTRPSYRLFLNEFVKESLPFRDGVPFGYRDMGLWPEQLLPRRKEEDMLYDFVYIGSVSRDMQMERLLDEFACGGKLYGHSLLVMSREYEELQARYRGSTNIIFAGPFEPSDVAAQLSRARFALNYKPDVAPHNEQTSTKLLEYNAAGLPVITTDLAWVRRFQANYGGQFYYLKPDLSNFDWELVKSFSYASADLSGWMWEQQIRRSGVLAFLESRFPSLRF